MRTVAKMTITTTISNVGRRLRVLTRGLVREVRVWQLVIADPRTPRPARWLLWAAVAYAVSPIDLIPDAIPLIGQLDDLLIVPVLVWLALRIVSPHVIEECRRRAAA